MANKIGYPLAYTQGYRWFFEHKFFVSPAVLIPRPETELLVELALEDLKNNKRAQILDIGTGSGAIIVSIAANQNYRAKNTALFATDISAKALNVARKNSKTILKLAKKKQKIKFLQGNLLAPLSKKLSGSKNLLILSNLPYLSAKELKEPSIKHEPRLALYGGTNDFDKISRLLKQIARLKIAKSKILLEIGYNQAPKIKKLAKQLWPDASLQIHKDLGKFDRVAEILI